MPAQLPIDREKIAEFCQRHHITEFALFGSVLREDFRPDSDVDVLVRFAPDAHPTLFTLEDMEAELRELFGRHVDLVDKRAVEASHNPYRRNAILRGQEVVHAA